MISFLETETLSVKFASPTSATKNFWFKDQIFREAKVMSIVPVSSGLVGWLVVVPKQWRAIRLSIQYLDTATPTRNALRITHHIHNF